MLVQLPSTLNRDVQSLEMDAPVELFEIDLSNHGEDNMFFHAGRNELSGNVIWQGVEYVAWPIEANGFKMSTQGAQGRPTLSVANIGGSVSGLNADFNDLIGCKLIRHRTTLRFLDAVNFEGGVNPDADATAEFPLEMYYIDRKSREDSVVSEYELATLIDLENINLPGRTVIRNVCTWKYRSSECSYAGANKADINDNLTSSSAYNGQDQCGKRLSSCKLRFGSNGLLPFGGFPATGIK